MEVIEAHYLFGASYDDIEIVVHPQSIIHSMVETQVIVIVIVIVIVGIVIVIVIVKVRVILILILILMMLLAPRTRVFWLS